MRPPPIPHPRRVGQHISEAIDLLTANGATNIRVYKTHHIAIVFNVGRHELTVRAPCTPASEDNSFNAIRQAIQREVLRATKAVRA